MTRSLIRDISIQSTCEDGQFFKESYINKNKGSEIYTHLSKGHKVVSSKRYIILDSGQEIFIPVTNLIEMLPDRTGFMVIYDETPNKFSEAKSYPWFFERPNNAAVYNSDGSLRFQVILTRNLNNDLYIDGFAQPSIEHPDKISVLINSITNPELYFRQLYAVDPNNPDLIETKQKIQR